MHATSRARGRWEGEYPLGPSVSDDHGQDTTRQLATVVRDNSRGQLWVQIVLRHLKDARCPRSTLMSITCLSSWCARGLRNSVDPPDVMTLTADRRVVQDVQAVVELRSLNSVFCKSLSCMLSCISRRSQLVVSGTPRPRNLGISVLTLTSSYASTAGLLPRQLNRRQRSQSSTRETTPMLGSPTLEC